MAENIEEQLVMEFIKLDADYKRTNALAEGLKKQRDDKEAELLDLLNDENKKSSARFKGIGHVTAMDPRVGNAYILEGQEQVVFDFLRKVGREDLIKTGVHHTSLAAFINQTLQSQGEAPPGVGYIMKQTLRAYPEKDSN